MSLATITLEIIDCLTHYDYYHTLTSAEISKRAGSHEELNKIRAKSKEHLSNLFADVSFYNTKTNCCHLRN